MILTPRLEAAKRLLDQCDTVADIGCDHGKLAIELIQSGLCARAIAADVSPDSLGKAKENVLALGLSERVDIRQGDGLSVLSPGEADCAVLLGMGGALIAKILLQDLEKAKSMHCLVLQPMQQAAELRRALRCNGFVIEDEVMLREGRWIYELLRVRAGEQSLPGDLPAEVLDEIGPVLWRKKEPLIAARMAYKLRAYQKHLAKARKGSTTGAKKGEAALLAQIETASYIIEQILRASEEA